MLFEDATSLVRTLVVGVLAYLSMVFVLRVSGKRTLSKWNAFDLIVTVALGSALATTILSRNTSLAQGMLVYALLAALQLVLTWLSVRFGRIEHWVKASPTLLLHEGRLLHDALRNERVTEAEVLAAVRGKGIASLEGVWAVVLETDGSCSVIPKPPSGATSTLSDVRSASPERALNDPQPASQRLEHPNASPSGSVTQGRRAAAADFFRRLYQEASNDDIFNGAAALAFFLTLAIFPAIVAIMALLPYLPVAHIDQEIARVLHQTLPPSSAQLINDVVSEVAEQRRGDLLSAGLVGTLWAASTGMYAVMQQLNVTLGIKERRNYLHGRAVALALSLLFVALATCALVLISLGGTLHAWAEQRLGLDAIVLAAFHGLRWLVIVLALLLAVALIYRFGPNRKRPFAFASWGSTLAVGLLILASLGFSWYAQHIGRYDVTYGSIGAVIALMFWLYLSGLAILLGSEIDGVLRDRRVATH